MEKNIRIRIPFKMLHPRNPPYGNIQIPPYKFKLNQNLSQLYSEYRFSIYNDGCCLSDFVRNSPVALLEAVCAQYKALQNEGTRSPFPYSSTTLSHTHAHTYKHTHKQCTCMHLCVCDACEHTVLDFGFRKCTRKNKCCSCIVALALAHLYS